MDRSDDRCMKPLLTTIEREGQPYVDDPVFSEVSEAKPLSIEIGALFGRRIESIEELSHYNHIRLRWVKPGDLARKEKQ